MAKEKKPLDTKKVPNRHLYSRISYLHQAAQYLAGKASEHQPTEDGNGRSTQQTGLPGLLTAHMLLVSQKSKVKISRDVKRSVCKRCNGLLVEGQTSRTRIENKSKGGKKPWADVLVVKCIPCGFEKRYTVGQERQLKKTERVKGKADRVPDHPTPTQNPQND
jgi:ribonuclease P protein subunit RPR2